MKIGVDFDNVLCDTNEIKKKYFLRKYGEIIPKEFSSKEIFETFGNERYQQMIFDLYNSSFFLNAKPINNSKEALEELVQKNEVYIITKRKDNTIKTVREWLENQGYSYNRFYNTNTKTKKYICKKAKVDILIDDSLENILDLRHINTYGILFNDKFKKKKLKNTHILQNWEEIIEFLKEYSQRYKSNSKNKN